MTYIRPLKESLKTIRYLIQATFLAILGFAKNASYPRMLRTISCFLALPSTIVRSLVPFSITHQRTELFVSANSGKYQVLTEFTMILLRETLGFIKTSFRTKLSSAFSLQSTGITSKIFLTSLTG